MNASIRLTVVAAVAIVLLGYLSIVRPLESGLAARYADLDAMRERLERDALLARRIPALSAERARLAGALSKRRLHDSSAAIVERFLRVTERVAKREHVAIQTLAAVPAGQPAPTAETPLFDELHLDITMRGAYDDVLRVARAINASDLAMQVSVAALGSTERHPGMRPQLNATFHITLLRETDAPPKSSAHAA